MAAETEACVEVRKNAFYTYGGVEMDAFRNIITIIMSKFAVCF